MKHILLSSALAITVFAPAAFAGERTVEITVGELTCPSCSFIVASSMRSIPSVQIDGFIDGPEYGQGIYNVTFDDAETSVKNIIDAVAENGYPARALPDTAS